MSKRKTLRESAREEGFDSVADAYETVKKERHVMANGKQKQDEAQQAGQDQQAPQMAPHHADALKAAGVDPQKVRGMNLAQILALIQAILAAAGPIIGTIQAGGNQPQPGQ
jgi:hypothetical protein